MALPPRGNRMPSHRFHTYCVCSPTESTLIACVLPQIFIVAEVSCLRRSKGSPTEYADLTEVFAENILPQISQNYTELLAECILPQISQNSRNFLLSLFSHRFHRFAQMVRAPSRGCTCLKCTNVTRGISILLGWCTSCSGKRQSRAETSAPPKISSFCVDLCNLWEEHCLLG